MHAIVVQAKLQRYQNERETYLVTEIEIGELLLVNHRHDGLGIDLAELARTLAEDGEFFIITCGCGVPSCAGIRQGIKVWRDRKNIHWKIKDWGKAPPAADTFSFNAALYALSVRRGLRDFLKLQKKNPDTEISPYLLRERLEFLATLDKAPWPELL